MRQVVPDVYVMHGLRSANVHLLSSSKGLALVDSGWAGDCNRILAQLQQAGHALSELRSIVITHWHGDHTGNAAELARRSAAHHALNTNLHRPPRPSRPPCPSELPTDRPAARPLQAHELPEFHEFP